MGFSLDEYLAKRQQTSVKEAGEAGGFSLDRYMSARRGGSWDIGGPNKGYGQSRDVGTALPGGLQAGGDKGRTGETAGPYKEQGQPTAGRNWKGLAQGTNAAALLGRTAEEKLALDVAGKKGVLEGVKASEQRALDWKERAGQEWHQTPDYPQATAAYEKARAKREEAEKAAAEAEAALNWHRYEGQRQNADFAQYAARGAAIENPSIDQAAGGSFGIGAQKIGNIVTFSRDNFDQLVARDSEDGPAVGNLSYHWMTDDEVDLYNYLLAKEGEEKAGEYLSYLEEELNYRWGAQMGKTVRGIENGFGRAAVTGLYGVGAGVDQFARGVRQLFSEERLPTSATQYGSAYIREDLKDAGPKIFGNSLGQLAYDATTATGNMAPSILLSALTAGAGTPAAIAEGVGSAALAASAGGNAYNQALREGYGKEEARNYAVLTAASEGALQYLLGGIGALGGKLTGKAAQTTVQNIDNALLRIGADLGVNMLGEGTEEYLQEILEPAFRNLCFDEHNEIKLVSEEAAYSFLLGAITAGLLEGPSTVSSNLDLNKTGAAVRQSGHFDALVERSLALDPKSEAASMAAQMRTGALHTNDINVGQLLTAYRSAGGSLDFMLTPQQGTAGNTPISPQEAAGARSDAQAVKFHTRRTGDRRGRRRGRYGHLHRPVGAGHVWAGKSRLHRGDGERAV